MDAYQSDSIGKLATALAAVQGQLKPVEESHTNPHFKSKYADLTDCWRVARSLLVAQGLAVIQAGVVSDNGPVLRTTLVHSSGEWIAGDYPLNPGKPDPQGLAAAVTYARRYSFCAIIGMTAGDDDDGNTASRPAAQQQPRAAEPAPAPAPTNGHHNGTPAPDVKELQGRVLKACQALNGCLTMEQLQYEWDGMTELCAAVKAHPALMKQLVDKKAERKAALHEIAF